MKIDSLEDLFICLLCDIYDIENQIVKDMPLMIKRATSDELKQVLQTHLEETKEHVNRLDQIFKAIDQQPRKTEWVGDVQNLFADADAFLTENSPSPVLDATIIAITQRIEHYEIATYGTLKEFAKVLDYTEVENILHETIKEEGHADRLLTKLAKGGLFATGINAQARG